MPNAFGECRLPRRVVSKRHDATGRNRDLEQAAGCVGPNFSIGAARISDREVPCIERGSSNRNLVGAGVSDAHDDLCVPARYDNGHGPRWASREEIILVKDLVVDDDRTRRHHEFVR